MIVRLFCPKCAYEASKKLKDKVEIEVPVPISKLSDSGEYEVHCQKGHRSIVILDNVKFELLFEMGINALVDGYPREAVSSFASSLEKFYEFYWRVVMNHFQIESASIEKTWKPLSKLSERQIGAYTSAALLLTKEHPSLLNSNKEVPFRNRVIHDGYVPTEQEAISFGDTVMQLINQDLNNLRKIAPEALKKIYSQMSPLGKHEESENDKVIYGCVNILTNIDVRFPPKGDDKRIGSVSDQFQRILDERKPKRMQLLSEEEMKKKFPGKKMPKVTNDR